MDTPLRILVAEDELGDVLLLQRAFTKAGVKAPVHIAGNGQEVLDYLQGNPPFDDPVAYPLPTLLLLDLRLPLVDGFEVMRWIRNHPAFRHLVVVVLSSSDRPEDISLAYELGANSYVVKPDDPKELVKVVDRLQRYWLGINGPAVRKPLLEPCLK